MLKGLLRPFQYYKGLLSKLVKKNVIPYNGPFFDTLECVYWERIGEGQEFHEAASTDKHTAKAPATKGLYS